MRKQSQTANSALLSGRTLPGVLSRIKQEASKTGSVATVRRINRNGDIVAETNLGTPQTQISKSADIKALPKPATVIKTSKGADIKTPPKPATVIKTDAPAKSTPVQVHVEVNNVVNVPVAPAKVTTPRAGYVTRRTRRKLKAKTP